MRSGAESDRPLVVHVIFRLDYGGLENGLVNLINGLPEGVCRHAVVTVAGYSGFRQRIRRADVEIYSLDKRPGKDPAAYGRFFRLLRKLRPALVHTRNLGTVDMQWVARVAGVRGRVHGEHGWDAADPVGASRRNLAIRRACRPAIQSFVALSEDIAAWLERQVGVSRSRIVQIYNGVDTQQFCPHGALPPDVPWSLEPGRKPIVLGTVGRLNPIKNQAALLEAFARLRRKSAGEASPVRLMMVGDGPSAAELRQRAQALGVLDGVWFAGARDDVAACLRACDIFVLPSLNEGVSNTVLEAMATERPVVAARVGGNPELVQHEKTGFLYDGADEDGLDDALARYCADELLRHRHGQAGRARAISEFGMARMMERYADLYRRHSAA